MKRIGSLVTAWLFVAALCVTATTPAHADGETPKIMLVLDSSGSMADADPSGSSKMDAAKQALINALGAMPSNAEVGLRVYGATNEGNGAEGACEDSQLVQPVAPLDQNALSASINGFQPKGDTPIAYSLQQAANDLGSEGKRHIILVSDGEETCDPDPCATIKGLIDSGVSIQIDTVGFAVDDVARKQLSCIAEVGGGTYYDAQDAQALTTSLERLSTRTARPFTVSGTPVAGTNDPGTAPELTAGQYTDISVSSATAKTTKFYRIKRTIPGSSIRVSTVARMPVTDWDTSADRATWSTALKTAGDTSCDLDGDNTLDGANMGVLFTSTVLALDMDPRVTETDTSEEKCAAATDLVFSIERGEGTADSTPVEIRVLEEPPAENIETLPNGVTVDTYDVPAGVTSPASGTPETVMGGASFNDALEVGSGTYTTEVVPGEVVFFKTKIGEGQSGVFALDGLDLSNDVLVRSKYNGYGYLKADLYGPDFSHMDLKTFSENISYSLQEPEGTEIDSPEISIVPEVRYRNRWDSEPMYYDDSLGFSMGGYYYYAVGLGVEDFLLGQPANIRFSIAVNDGGLETSASPTTTSTADPSPAATSSASDDSSAPSESDSLKQWLLWGGFGLMVVGVGGTVFSFIRRRS